MQLRSTIKTAATFAAVVVIIPFFQAPASKVAEKTGFDKLLFRSPSVATAPLSLTLDLQIGSVA
jgi:hypothetical protein